MASKHSEVRLSKYNLGNRKASSLSGSNPNRMKMKVGGDKLVIVKSRVATRQVDVAKRRY